MNTCKSCRHFEGQRTPTGRLKKKAGQCNGVVTLVAPIAYKVTLSKHYVWPDTDASKCPTYEG